MESLDFVTQETNKLACKAIKEKARKLDIFEVKSILMKGAWAGIRKAREQGLIVESLGPALRTAAAAVRNPQCHVTLEPSVKVELKGEGA